MKKKFAVILSGCGVIDGAEIHEATLTLLAVKKHNCEYEIFAPDIAQADVVNHLTGKTENQKRNVLEESARIARGKAKQLGELKVDKFDAIVLPGGFGVAKNLCDFAFKGADYTVNAELSAILIEANKLGKPIGAMCIAPIILAKVFPGSSVTVGNACDASAAIEKIGSKHIVKSHAEVVVDSKYRLVTTPCYMLNADIVQIAEGTENLVKEILELL